MEYAEFLEKKRQIKEKTGFKIKPSDVNPMLFDFQRDIVVWMDINQSDTLNFRIARGEKDEKHICPLQLGVIERCMELWSNHGDTFLTPFAGIGSEAFIAIKKGRKPVAIELKQEYYDQMKVNVIHGHDLKNENKLFED